MVSNPAAVDRSTASTRAQDSASTGSNTSSGTGLDSMFMQLLLTQLQNQDPLSPMDPSTFVSQLVQVNSLDQVTQINQLLQNTFITQGSSTSSAGGH